MAEPHLDHPGEIHWFNGHGPAPVQGPCPHQCPHYSHTCIAHGPDLTRYTLEVCNDSAGCNGTCRAWHDGRIRATTPWLNVEPTERTTP